MCSVVLGKIKNFGWGLLNQTRRLPALPGGFARDAIRRRHPGTPLARPDWVARRLQWRLAARGQGQGAPVVTGARSNQRRRPRLHHQLLTGMAKGVSAIAQMMMVTMLILPLLPTDAAGMCR